MNSAKLFQTRGPELRYQRTLDAQLYPVKIPKIPYSGGTPGRTRISVKFGRFKVRDGELKTVKVSEEKCLSVALPTKILVTSAAIKQQIEIYSDANEISRVAIEGIEYFRAKLLEAEKKPEPTCGVSLGKFLEARRSGDAVLPHDLKQMADKIRVMKMACLGLGDTEPETTIQSALNLAIVFSNIELPEMIGIVTVTNSAIQLTDFDNNNSQFCAYNRDRQARLTTPLAAILLGKAIISFE